MKFPTEALPLWSCSFLVCFSIFNVEAQLVGLRNPPGLEPGSGATLDRQSKVNAKPGDVLVHFDKKNEVQQVQYVLRDGRLATLFQRRPTDFYGRQADPLPNAISFVHRRSELESPPKPGASEVLTNTPVTPQAPPTTHLGLPEAPLLDSTRAPTQNGGYLTTTGADKNDKLQGMPNTKQVGDNSVTVVVPDRKIFPMSIDLKQFPIASLPLSDKIDILATVASDAAHVTAPLRKAMMDKLKSKVSQKMRELPGLIEAKLRAKSSVGHMILEKASSRFVPVEDGQIRQSPAAASFEPSHFIVDSNIP